MSHLIVEADVTPREPERALRHIWVTEYPRTGLDHLIRERRECLECQSRRPLRDTPAATAPVTAPAIPAATMPTRAALRPVR